MIPDERTHLLDLPKRPNYVHASRYNYQFIGITENKETC